LDNDSTEALLAVPFTFSAKLVIFLPTSIIKKDCPFLLEILWHSGHHAPPVIGSTKQKNAQYLSELFVFGMILSVFIRFERL
jgi:hypothetical protein